MPVFGDYVTCDSNYYDVNPFLEYVSCEASQIITSCATENWSDW